MLASLMAASLSVVAATDHPRMETIVKAPPHARNVSVKTYSSMDNMLTTPISGERTIDYPTQIVRLQGEVGESGLNCDQVHRRIENFFTGRLNHRQFYYVTMTWCAYDLETGRAMRYGIDSYFDPLTDQAVAFWEQWLAENNGVSLMGVPFHVEAAEGMAMSLNLDAGLVEANDDSVLTRFRHENASHYFASHYDMVNTLAQDVKQSFFSNDPDRILPFLHQWLLIDNEAFYRQVLRSSNYVSLQPERLFLMSKAPRVYTSPLRMYYAHHCDKYKNGRCL
ncbi:Lpg0189 family type II secretion system effector [Legionella sp. CNM-4043-24]|uniref:Lpg0189 family type II secretion system effector n=1 Tax=Legionella sp. CNM-4043-24 TaxID=3421646 RepID=UPI00403B261B